MFGGCHTNAANLTHPQLATPHTLPVQAVQPVDSVLGIHGEIGVLPLHQQIDEWLSEVFGGDAEEVEVGMADGECRHCGERVAGRDRAWIDAGFLGVCAVLGFCALDSGFDVADCHAAILSA